MLNFAISVDSPADIPDELLDSLGIFILRHGVKVGKGEKIDRVASQTETQSFISDTDGVKFSFCAPSRKSYEDHFDDIAENSRAILHISVGSAFSKGYDNAFYAAKNTMVKYPKTSVYVIDSHSTGAGLALILDAAILIKNSGASAEEAFARLLTIVASTAQYVILGDMKNYCATFPSSAGEMALKSKVVTIIGIDRDGKPSVFKKYASAISACNEMASLCVATSLKLPTYVYGSPDVSFMLKAVSALRRKNVENIRISSLGLFNCAIFGEKAISIAFTGAPIPSAEKKKVPDFNYTDFIEFNEDDE